MYFGKKFYFSELSHFRNGWPVLRSWVQTHTACFYTYSHWKSYDVRALFVNFGIVQPRKEQILVSPKPLKWFLKSRELICNFHTSHRPNSSAFELLIKERTLKLVWVLKITHLPFFSGRLDINGIRSIDDASGNSAYIAGVNYIRRLGTLRTHPI